MLATLKNRKSELEEEIKTYKTLIDLKLEQLNMIDKEINIISKNTDSNEIIKENESINFTSSDDLKEKYKDLVNNIDINSKSDLLSILNDSAITIDYRKKNFDNVVRNITLNLDIAREYTGDTELKFFNEENIDSDKKNKKRILSDNYIYAFDLDNKQMKKFIIKNIIDVELFQYN